MRCGFEACAAAAQSGDRSSPDTQGGEPWSDAHRSLRIGSWKLSGRDSRRDIPDTRYVTSPVGARGIALVWTAVFLLVLIGIVGLSLDWGKTAFNVHQLHNAADAAALCGAQVGASSIMAHARRPLACDCHRRRELLPTTCPCSCGQSRTTTRISTWIVGFGCARRISSRRSIRRPLYPTNAVKVVGIRLGERDDAPALRLHWGPVFRTDDCQRDPSCHCLVDRIDRARASSRCRLIPPG